MKNKKENQTEILEALIEKFKDNKLIQLFTPTVSALSVYDSYVDADHQKEIVKLNGPNGEVEALRYDSTIAMITSKLFSKEGHFFYREPQFSYDFDQLKIRERTQLGVEYVQKKSEIKGSSYFETCMLLVKEISDLLCAGSYQIELSNSKIMDDLLLPMKLEEKVAENLKYYIGRKNERKAVDVMNKNRVDPIVQKKLLAQTRVRTFLHDADEKLEKLNLPLDIKKWMGSMASLNNALDQCLIMDFNSSTHLNYYQGNIFKVYDMESHKEIISGGEYFFPEFNIIGCGFSIKI